MAKEATLQVRMDAQLKEQVEALYKRLGTSFAEAVRVFARKSLLENGMPFVISTPHVSARGTLAEYAVNGVVGDENHAWERAALEKHSVRGTMHDTN